MRCHYQLYSVVTVLLLLSANSIAQQAAKDSLPAKKVVVAGPAYERSGFHQWLWGTNRRKEWATPIQVPVLRLDAVHGGLQPVKTGGGHETKSLQLQTAHKNEYTLRTINKDRRAVVPAMFKGTFAEDIVQDEVSMSHPYGAVTIPIMLQQAGIYHARPSVVYLPPQPALDTFNDTYGNNVYLFEQRSDGDWSNADNFGNATDFHSTEKLVKKLLKGNTGKVDQRMFIKARLFDMLIGDWDRHEDNWRWIEKDSAGRLWYRPVPRDRDQAYFTHNGVLANLLISAAGLKYMQNFDGQVKNKKIADLNWEQRNLDRFFSNEMTQQDWVQAATNLQQALTDAVIEQAIRQLPPEIFAVSGNELIEKLKSRRQQLVSFATTYYRFLAKEVEVVGSKEREYVEVNKLPSGETSVAVYRLDDEARKQELPYYKRIFNPSETKEIRIYGIDAQDMYVVNGHSKGIKMRVIAGPEKDSAVVMGNKIHLYDNVNDDYGEIRAKLHLSTDSSIHEYKYKGYNYSKSGFSPTLFYSNEDRIFVGIKYKYIKHKWRKTPYATKQTIGLNYSISQNAISATYDAIYPDVFRGWNLLLFATYDAVRWTNFYGTGNNSIMETKDRNYNRMRSEEWMASSGLEHPFGKSTIGATVYYQRLKIKNDSGRHASKTFEFVQPEVFTPYHLAGLRLTYSFAAVNDSVVPTKGFTVLANAVFARNLTQKDFYQDYNARMQAYWPLSKKFSLAVRAGGGTITNRDDSNIPIMYQYSVIGGARNLRGYRRERFWGNTSFYNNNELRYITNLNTRLLNGKIGVIGFFDNGRVWMPGEDSRKLHTSFGGGLLLAPFNKACATITYGVSNEIGLVQIRINTLF
jgi:hypothetical protein